MKKEYRIPYQYNEKVKEFLENSTKNIKSFGGNLRLYEYNEGSSYILWNSQNNDMTLFGLEKNVKELEKKFWDKARIILLEQK